MSDRELLEQAQAGDDGAFQLLVEPHRGLSTRLPDARLGR